MSVKIHKNQLDPNKEAIIRKCLVLYPEIKNHGGMNINMGSSPTPINFYVVTPEYVYLPYSFTVGLFQQHINFYRTYPNVYFKFDGILKDHQIPIVREALDQLRSFGTTTINASTGSGKTIIGSVLTAELSCLTCVIFANEPLIKQWLFTFENFLPGTKIWVVGTKPPPEAHIIICMKDRYDHIPLEYREMIGLLIIDEADTLCTTTGSNCILSFCPKYIIAMTATLDRNDKMESMIHALCGKHKVIYKQSKKYTIVCVRTGMIYTTIPNKSGKGIDWPDFEKKLCSCTHRNLMVLSIINKHPDEKFIILTPRSEHVDQLEALIKQIEQSVSQLKGSVKNCLESRILIGTTKKLGRGFDEAASYENFSGVRARVLILMVPPATIPPLIQEVGRIRRDDPIIYLMIDKNKQMTNHWSTCKKWFISEDADISELKF